MSIGLVGIFATYTNSLWLQESNPKVLAAKAARQGVRPAPDSVLVARSPLSLLLSGSPGAGILASGLPVQHPTVFGIMARCRNLCVWGVQEPATGWRQLRHKASNLASLLSRRSERYSRLTSDGAPGWTGQMRPSIHPGCIQLPACCTSWALGRSADVQQRLQQMSPDSSVRPTACG